jgi:hypothetical protein
VGACCACCHGVRGCWSVVLVEVKSCSSVSTVHILSKRTNKIQQQMGHCVLHRMPCLIKARMYLSSANCEWCAAMRTLSRALIKPVIDRLNVSPRDLDQHSSSCLIEKPAQANCTRQQCQSHKPIALAQAHCTRTSPLHTPTMPAASDNLRPSAGSRPERTT